MFKSEAFKPQAFKPESWKILGTEVLPARRGGDRRKKPYKLWDTVILEDDEELRKMVAHLVREDRLWL